MKNIDKDEELLNREFDFSKAVKNPYAGKLKKQVTKELSPATINPFKDEAARDKNKVHSEWK